MHRLGKRGKGRVVAAIMSLAMCMTLNSGIAFAEEYSEEAPAVVYESEEGFAVIEDTEEYSDDIEDVLDLEEESDLENSEKDVDEDVISDDITSLDDSGTLVDPEIEVADQDEVVSGTAPYDTRYSEESSLYGWKFRLLLDGTYCCTRYTTSSVEDGTPTDWNGKPVTAIADYSGRLNILDITAQIINIYDNTFKGNGSIYKFKFKSYDTGSSSLRYIGKQAFSGMAQLEDIDLTPTGVTTIDSQAFANNPVLEEVRLPASVSSIASDAFSNCPMLSIIYVSKGSYAENYFNTVYPQCNPTCAYTIRYLEGGTGGSGGGSGTSLNDAKFQLAGCSVVYDGKIGIRFYYSLNTAAENAYLSLKIKKPDGNYGYTEEVVDFSQLKKEYGYYSYVVYVLPKEATRPVSTCFCRGNNIYSDTFSCSLVDYATAMINTSTNTTCINVVKSLMTYCDAAQEYFRYFPENKYIAYKLKIKDSDLYKSDLSAYAPIIRDNNYIGMSMVLEEDITLKVYYKGDISSIAIGTDTNIVTNRTNNITKYSGYSICSVKGFVGGKSASSWPGVGMGGKFYLSTANSTKTTTMDQFYGVYSYLYIASQSSSEYTKRLAYSIYYWNERCKEYSSKNDVLMTIN